GPVEVDLDTPSSQARDHLLDQDERHEISWEILARELPRHPGNVYGAAVVPRPERYAAGRDAPQGLLVLHRNAQDPALPNAFRLTAAAPRPPRVVFFELRSCEASKLRSFAESEAPMR